MVLFHLPTRRTINHRATLEFNAAPTASGRNIARGASDGRRILDEVSLIIQIIRGAYRQNVFAAARWAMFCAELDPNPQQSGCLGMHNSEGFVTRQGAKVELFIEGPNAGHGGFHQTPAQINAALDGFARALAEQMGIDRISPVVTLVMPMMFSVRCER